MNYLRIYENLVLFRQQHPARGYTENHHIIMRSLGGSDEPSNLVRLTGREHWVAHLLLHKIYRKPQTAHACHMMAMKCEERGIPYVRNSRMYEEIRKECAKLASLRMRSLQKGQGNSQFGTMWICNTDLKQNKKILKTEEIPRGWICGRNKWPKEIKAKDAKKHKRKKLPKALTITNGVDVKRLFFEDQLPIPEGWELGGYPCSEERKQKLQKTLGNIPRHYRRGMKYKKIKRPLAE